MYLKITVETHAHKETVFRESEDRLRVAVRAPPARGQANRRVLELVRELYPAHRVTLVSGHQAPRKIVEILPKTGRARIPGSKG